MSSDGEVSGRKTISGLSGRAVKPIALRHIMEIAQNPIMSGLRKAGNKRVELSGIGGIETWRDALEFIQLGCNNMYGRHAVWLSYHRRSDIRYAALYGQAWRRSSGRAGG